MATQNPPIVIDIVVEGRADGGVFNDKPEPPMSGIVTLFVHRLCQSPSHMLVRRQRVPFLMNAHKPWRRLVQAKDRAAIAKSAGLVYVVDTESTDSGVLKQMRKSHLPPPKSRHDQFPAALGFAHPCIEAWLLCDAVAIKKAAGVPAIPPLPAAPESLPGAPKNKPGAFYKRYLADLVKASKDDLAAKDKWIIVVSINDLKSVRDACPCFHAFASEIESKIAPLYFAT